MPGDADGGNNEKLICPNCENPNLTWKHEKGEVVCPKCGAVVKEKSFDRGPEWRAFDQEEKETRSRGGPPTTNTLHDKGLSTEISPKNRDARGNSLSPERRAQMHRVRKWNRRSKTKTGQSRYLRDALSKIKDCVSRLQLPTSVQERASTLYRKASRKDLIKGKPKEEMVVATLYEACKWAGFPRSFDELSRALPPATVGGSRSSHLKLKQNVEIEQEIVEPGAYISKFCRKLGVPNKVRKTAVDIAGKTLHSGFKTERSAEVLSAGIVYLATIIAGGGVSQGYVEDRTGVSRASFGDAKDELMEFLGKEGYRDLKEG